MPIRWMRPRGESISSPHSEYVGTGRQAEPAVHAGVDQLAGRRAHAPNLHHPLLEPAQLGRSTAAHVGEQPAARPAADHRVAPGSAQLRDPLRARPPAGSGAACRPGLPPRGARPTAARRPRRSRRRPAPAPARPARPATGLSKRTSSRSCGQRVLDAGRRQRLEHGRIARRRHQRARPRRQRVQPQRQLQQLGPAGPSAPGEQLGQVVAGHVLDHLAAAADHACRPAAARGSPRIRSRGRP